MVLDRLARICYRRRWLVVGVWIVALFGIAMANRAAGGQYVNNFELPGTESQRAFELLEHRFPQQAGDTADIVFKADSGVFDPSVADEMQELFARVSQVPTVSGVASPYQAGGRPASPDGRIAIATVRFGVRGPEVPVESVERLVELVEEASRPGIQVEVGGRVIQFGQQEGPGSREGIGVLAAIVILLITFGSLIAMGLPLLTAIFGLGIGLSLLGLLLNVMDAPIFTPQIATMIGLGVGIDYALFIVTRYRQALHSGMQPEDAVALSLRTSGRAVIFAGTTVVISLMGMFLMGLSFVRGLATGAALVVLLTVGTSITLLPAILGFAGHAIDKFRVPALHRDESDHRASFWFRWSRVVQRRPWVTGGAALVVLLVLASPVLSLRLGSADARSEPTTRTTRRAYDLIAEGYGVGFNGPFLLVAELSEGADVRSLQALAAALQTTPGVAFALPPQPNPAGDTAVLMVVPTTGPQDVQTEELVHRLRDEVIPQALEGTGVRVSVGGVTALFIDMAGLLGSRLPWFMGGVIGLSFLLLLVVFRSVLVPLKAAIMNLLSIGAAFGAVVAIFQWGWLSGLIGLGATGPIEFFLPMMLFAILFGLSMDYEVFLLSRVREEYLRHGDNGVAVADGLAATARVITAAAAIMVTLFLSFVLGDDRLVKLFGLGLAIAIFLDATVIRMVLVPSTMELLGKANWWFPRWLDRIVPRVSVEAAVEVPPVQELPAEVAADAVTPPVEEAPAVSATRAVPARRRTTTRTPKGRKPPVSRQTRAATTRQTTTRQTTTRQTTTRQAPVKRAASAGGAKGKSSARRAEQDAAKSAKASGSARAKSPRKQPGARTAKGSSGSASVGRKRST